MTNGLDQRYSTFRISYSTSPRGFDHHHIVLLFADQTARHRRVYRNQIFLEIGLIVANDAVSHFFFTVGFITDTVAPKITRPVFGILVISIT